MEQVKILVPNISQLLSIFDKAGLPIFDVRTELKADRSNWSRLMLKYDHPCLLENTPDVEPIDGYSPPQTARKIIKTANSAFLRTRLEEMLQDEGITRLVLAGVFIRGCVGLTAADAAQRGFDVTLIDNAIGHTDRHSRDPFFEWLFNDYEIKALSTADFVKGFRDQN